MAKHISRGQQNSTNIKAERAKTSQTDSDITDIQFDIYCLICISFIGLFQETNSVCCSIHYTFYTAALISTNMATFMKPIVITTATRGAKAVFSV